MSFDLVLKGARLATNPEALVDIGIANGKIAAIAPDLVDAVAIEAIGGGLVAPGLVETHIHLDKSCIIDRCCIREGSLKEAIAQTARAKRAFTEDDIFERARGTLERAILGGTMQMRTHVEVDPRVGLKGFRAVRELARRYQWAVDLSICVFPQEGLLNDAGSEALLVEACQAGADLIGGCPYADTQPIEHIARIFAIARRFDLAVDFHLDFDLDGSWMHLDEVLRQTEHTGYGGRVTVGHVSKLSAVPPARQIEIARRLAAAGVAVTVLPATDLFLMGRDSDYNVPRGVTRADRLAQHGVTCSLASNNVLNAFTPFGDASLIRMANLYANVAQLGRRQDFELCFDMITGAAARLMNLDGYGLAVGDRADLLVLPCQNAAAAVTELSQPLMGFKRGRRSFTRPPTRLHQPNSA
ncbi:MAG TPA: amidohydrolase family protein [Hyphomicrobiaceae bacterium]|jgi:cytosine/creatinine deaminase|nr:amidohydrolase family protein [Hyphomicrobiaceae bacterium]